MPKILVVEDDTNLRTLVCDCLRADKHLVEVAEDGLTALELMLTYPYDLIILDLALPKMDGIAVCNDYRAKKGSGRVLMLTGRNTVDEKETGFDAGADDYLTKPFDSRELMMRVRALLRRSTQRVPDVVSLGTLTIDERLKDVLLDGKPLHLTPTEYTLLYFFMHNPNEVFSANALLDRLWRSESEASPLTVRTCINRLRSKIGESDGTPVIKNVFGVGYKLEANE